MAWWRRQTIAMHRFVIAATIVVVWFTALYFWSLAVPPVSQPGPLYSKDEHWVWHRGDVWFFGIAGGLLLAFVAMAVWAILRLLRNDSTKFSDLDGEEQGRRHQAGTLLRQGFTDQPTEPAKPSEPSEPADCVDPGPRR